MFFLIYFTLVSKRNNQPTPSNKDTTLIFNVIMHFRNYTVGKDICITPGILRLLHDTLGVRGILSNVYGILSNVFT